MHVQPWIVPLDYGALEWQGLSSRVGIFGVIL